MDESDTLKLADVMERMHATNNLHIVPSDFNHVEFISSLTNSEKVPEGSEGLQTNLNEIASFLTHENVLPKAKMFIGLQWSRIFSLIRKQVSENVHKKVQRKEFTGHFPDLHELLLSKDLEREFAELMNIPVSLLDEHHYHAITEIVLSLNSHISRLCSKENFREPFGLPTMPARVSSP